MLRGDTTGTFLENVSTAGGPQLGSYTSYSHGWAAAPTSYLTTKVLGVEPDGAGFSSFTVTPQPGSLQWARGRRADTARRRSCGRLEAHRTPGWRCASRRPPGRATAGRPARRHAPGDRLDRHDRAGGQGDETPRDRRPRCSRCCPRHGVRGAHARPGRADLARAWAQEDTPAPATGGRTCSPPVRARSPRRPCSTAMPATGRSRAPPSPRCGRTAAPSGSRAPARAAARRC